MAKSYRRSDSSDDFSGFESEMSLERENPDRGGRQRGGETNPFMNQGGGTWEDFTTNFSMNSETKPRGVPETTSTRSRKRQPGSAGDRRRTRISQVLEGLCDEAMVKVRLVGDWMAGAGDGVAVMDMKIMKSNLEFLYKKIAQKEDKIEEWGGSIADVAGEDVRSNRVQGLIWESMGIIEHLVEVEATRRVETNKLRMIKTEASRFPDYDGTGNFGIWEENWLKLARHSGLNEECLGIKLRDNIKGRAYAYIGETGMQTYTKDELMRKLKLRYNIPWVKTQAASRKLMELEAPSSSIGSIVKYVDGVREAIDACSRADLTLEHVFLNICLDNLPIIIKGQLSKGLARIHPDYKFTKETFEKEFSHATSLCASMPVTSRMSMLSMGSEKVSEVETMGMGATGVGNSQRVGEFKKPRTFDSEKTKKPVCILCSPARHWHSECIFNTPAKRRKRLVLIGRCQACTTPVGEHGRLCSHKARCREHPGGRHVHWTCDGASTTHPGPQDDIVKNTK